MRFLPLLLLLLVSPLLSQTKEDTLRAKTAFLEDQVLNFRVANYRSDHDSIWLDWAGKEETKITLLKSTFSSDSLLEILYVHFYNDSTFSNEAGWYMYYNGNRTYFNYHSDDSFLPNAVTTIEVLPDTSYLLQWEGGEAIYFKAYCHVKFGDTRMELIPFEITHDTQHFYYNTFDISTDILCSTNDLHDTTFYFMQYDPRSLTIFYRYTAETNGSGNCNTWDGELRFENGRFVQQEEHLAVPQPIKNK